MAPLSRLTLQNAAATLTIPPYLLARRFLSSKRDGKRWVIGGHSGQMYADNAAALHRHLLAEGHDVTWISADEGVTRMLHARHAKVLARNSFEARRAIERACVLAYSHGPTDLDHLLLRCCAVPGLRVHLNHCMSHLKVWRSKPVSPSRDDFVRAPVTDDFDYMLASSARERSNLLYSFPGAGARIRIGGGAHLDAFMRARGQQPERLLVYFPTFRETRAGRQKLAAVVRALVTNERLRRWLVQEEYQLYVVGHMNSGRNAVYQPGSHIRFPSSSELESVLLQSTALISDYSGVLCDYLALDRPVVFFPFDQHSYLRTRELYVDYDQLVFGPRVDNVDALVDLVVSGEYRNDAPFEARRRYWQREFFPELKATYVQRTMATINDLLAQDVERGCPA